MKPNNTHPIVENFDPNLNFAITMGWDSHELGKGIKHPLSPITAQFMGGLCSIAGETPVRYPGLLPKSRMQGYTCNGIMHKGS